MKKIYYLTHDSDVYKEFEVADDFPMILDNNFVDVPPQSNLKYPTWNDELKRWEEDKDKLIAELMAKQDEQGAAMLEAINSMIGDGSNVSVN